MPPTPFLIGVDLGTTNSAVAAVDTRKRNPRVEVFRIPQLTAPGVVESWPVLPSFLYFPEPDEIAAGGVALPWEPNPSAIVGVLARDRGALAPARHVDSAKSWLAHSGVDRHAAFLPWGSTGAAPRISPVDASARYLIAPARRVERDDGVRRRSGGVRTPVDRAHRAGIIRRRGPRADRRSGAGGAVVQADAAGGTDRRVLRVDRRTAEGDRTRRR